MALPETGRLSLSDIVGEFGGVAPHKLSEYYGKDNVPGSGRLSISDFYGTSDLIVTHTLNVGQISNDTYGYSKTVAGALTPIVIAGVTVQSFQITTRNTGEKDGLMLGSQENGSLKGRTLIVTFAGGEVFELRNLHQSVTVESYSSPSIPSGFSEYIYSRLNQTIAMNLRVV